MCDMDEIKRVLDEVRSDNISGSGTLLQELTTGLLTLCTEEQDTPEISSQELLHLFASFRNEMNDFAVVSHFCNYIIENIEKENAELPNLKSVISKYIEKWRDINDRVTEAFLNSVDIRSKTVLLHSQSSTIISLFKKFKEISHETVIIQTESRPVLEGRKQAEELAQMGFHVNIVTDTGFTPLLDKIDMAILGADRIYKDHFINKTGSYAIALLCREKNIPVYVLADSRKYLKSVYTDTKPEKLRTAGEVWNDPPESISPVNYYFETVPIKLVSEFFSEKDQ